MTASYVKKLAWSAIINMVQGGGGGGSFLGIVPK